ncbi:MAG: hypothetical protein QXY35_02690, partial [Thermofilaceae archaeon]
REPQPMHRRLRPKSEQSVLGGRPHNLPRLAANRSWSGLLEDEANEGENAHPARITRACFSA